MRIAFLIVAFTATAAAAQTPPQGDRYGPRQEGAAAAASGWTGPMLSWSRKVQPAARRATPQRLANGLYAGPAEPTVRLARAAPPPMPRAPAALPDSLYAQPQAAPAASDPVTAYASSGPRFYSVYREYGGQPDPIALPPPGTTWAHRPEASLIEPLDPPKKQNDDDRPASEADGDWGASGDGLLGDPS